MSGSAGSVLAGPASGNAASILKHHMMYLQATCCASGKPMRHVPAVDQRMWRVMIKQRAWMPQTVIGMFRAEMGSGVSM
jgi:hypothetical protein